MEQEFIYQEECIICDPWLIMATTVSIYGTISLSSSPQCTAIIRRRNLFQLFLPGLQILNSIAPPRFRNFWTMVLARMLGVKRMGLLRWHWCGVTRLYGIRFKLLFKSLSGSAVVSETTETTFESSLLLNVKCKST